METPTLAIRDRVLDAAFGVDVAALRARSTDPVQFEERPEELTLDLAVRVIEESRSPQRGRRAQGE